MLGPGLSVEASSAKELVARKLDLNLIVSRVALPADARLVACSGDVTSREAASSSSDFIVYEVLGVSFSVF